MAGNYSDVPSWRMAYDRDGTRVFTVSSGVPTEVSAAAITNLNKEPSSGTGLTEYLRSFQSLVFIFPELRDLDAYVNSFYGITSITGLVSVSQDTTNGVDGTWTSIGSHPTNVDNSGSFSPTHWRTAIISSTALGIKAVRFSANSTYGAMKTQHLYGEPVPGANPNRLDIWHPTDDQRVTPAFFDFGDFPRLDTIQKTFRVKNRSATQTATSIRVAMEVLTDKTPSTPGQFQLSLDGSTYLAQVNIGTLAPGAISGPIMLRGSLTDSAALGLAWFRVFAEGTW